MSRESQALLEAFEHLRQRRSAPWLTRFSAACCPSIPAHWQMKRSAPLRLFCSSPSTRKMPAPQRGEVWLIDFGSAGKTRPALVVSVAFGDQDRAYHGCAAHRQPAWPSLRNRRAGSVSQARCLSGPGRHDFPNSAGPASVGHSPAAGVRKGHRRPAVLVRTFSRGLTPPEPDPA